MLARTFSALTFTLQYLHAVNQILHAALHKRCNGADIKRVNQKHRNDQLNRSVQNLLFTAVANSQEKVARKALSIIVNLWRSRVWRDARTVSIIGESSTWHAWEAQMLQVRDVHMSQFAADWIINAMHGTCADVQTTAVVSCSNLLSPAATWPLVDELDAWHIFLGGARASAMS